MSDCQLLAGSVWLRGLDVPFKKRYFASQMQSLPGSLCPVG
jgi:hypothetical protein